MFTVLRGWGRWGERDGEDILKGNPLSRYYFLSLIFMCVCLYVCLNVSVCMLQHVCNSQSDQYSTSIICV